MRLVQHQVSVPSTEVTERDLARAAARRRRFEAYVDMLPSTDPIFDKLADQLEQRMIELSQENVRKSA